MATDIKLDQGDGSWLLFEGSVLKTTAADFMLDSAGRRHPGGPAYRRALVHDFQDGLTINYNGDYRGGVTVVGNLAVTGDVHVHGIGSIVALRDAVTARLDALERTVEQLVKLAGAAVVPAWRTKTEVEEGDDMGVMSSAAQLGLVVDYQIDQQNPDFQHDDVISITPPAGTLVLSGSTVVVRINLEG